MPGDQDQVTQARALIERAASGLASNVALEGPLAEVDEALRIADAVADASLRLDALDVRAQLLTALGEASADDWRAVEEASAATQSWPRAAAALRMQVMALLDDHAPDAGAPADRLARLASARRLTGDLAWAEASRAEIAFVTGRWDEALNVAVRAVSVAARTPDAGAATRAWHVVIPIAAARQDETRLSLAYYAYEQHRADAPASAYRRMLDAAAALLFAEAGLAEDPVTPKPDELLPSFEGTPAMPHWLAAVETVTGRWIASGEFAAAEHALERMSAAHATGHASGLAAAVEALLRGRLLLAEGAPQRGAAAQFWRALRGFTAAGSPWWVARAIRALEETGDTTPDLSAEAERIESVLL